MGNPYLPPQSDALTSSAGPPASSDESTRASASLVTYFKVFRGAMFVCCLFLTVIWYSDWTGKTGHVSESVSTSLYIFVCLTSPFLAIAGCRHRRFKKPKRLPLVVGIGLLDGVGLVLTWFLGGLMADNLQDVFLGNAGRYAPGTASNLLLLFRAGVWGLSYSGFYACLHRWIAKRRSPIFRYHLAFSIPVSLLFVAVNHSRLVLLNPFFGNTVICVWAVIHAFGTCTAWWFSGLKQELQGATDLNPQVIEARYD